jgi:hypothetical protein
LGKALAVKVAEVQSMARHVLRNALVLWLSGQHLNRPCKSGEATKATGKQKWPTLRNVGIRYRINPTLKRVVARIIAHASACNQKLLNTPDDPNSNEKTKYAISGAVSQNLYA